jgi:hypothetical protein
MQYPGTDRASSVIKHASTVRLAMLFVTGEVRSASEYTISSSTVHTQIAFTLVETAGNAAAGNSSSQYASRPYSKHTS